MNQLGIAAWAAMVGSAIFVGVFTLEGSLRPGYDPLAMHISALSLGPRGWIQIANFVVLGVLLALFARGVGTEFRTGKASRGGVILLATMAVMFIVSGAFVMDPAATPQSQASIQGTIHALAGGIIFLLMPISIFVFLRRFRVDPKWQSMQSWTLVLGIIEAVAVFIFIVASKAPQVQSAVSPWLGLIQRTALVPFMFWLFMFGLELHRRSKQG